MKLFFSYSKFLKIGHLGINIKVSAFLIIFICTLEFCNRNINSVTVAEFRHFIEVSLSPLGSSLFSCWGINKRHRVLAWRCSVAEVTLRCCYKPKLCICDRIQSSVIFRRRTLRTRSFKYFCVKLSTDGLTSRYKLCVMILWHRVKQRA